MKLPPLENLRIFEVVARRQGFTAAAEELAMSHSAISRRISELEARMGVLLLQRTSRRVTLTVAGHTLFDAARDALQRIEEACTTITRTTRQRALLVSCERSLAMRWLIPRLSGFQDVNPDLPVYLSTGGGAIDFAHENIDLAIRRADFPIDPRIPSIALFEEYIGPVVPAHHPQSVSRATRATRLHTTGRPDAWDVWEQHNGSDKHANRTISGTPHDQYFDHFFLNLQAAEAGLGCAIAPLFMVADSLTAGRLLAPSGFIADGTHYIALLRKPLEQETPEARFMAWLQDTAAATIMQTQLYRQAK
jgi:DNA-binding transcriptional LysR family regulator